MSFVQPSKVDLTPLMDPRSIGIVGASQRGSRGTRVLENLLTSKFGGGIYPINPRYEEIKGIKCYPSAAEVPDTLDCIVVATPGATVPQILSDARAAGTRSAVILSSGFREAGPEGLRRQLELEELVKSGMPICGPNCYGVLNLTTGAAAFSGRIPEPMRTGELAFVSQSGGFTNMIVNPLVEDRGLGFKYMISCGNQVGIRIEDYLRYLVEDDDVRVIGCFAEGLSSTEALLEIGAEAARRGKYIVMLKTGRSEVAQQAVASHTGSLAGSGEVVDAVLARAGILQASCLDELAEMLCLLAAGDPARIGDRLLVVTGSGGESSHAADAAQRAGVVLPELNPASITRLRDEVLPEFGNPRNPLDGTGSMFENPDVFPGLMKVAVEDSEIDLVLVNLGQRPPEGPYAPMRQFAKAIAELPEAARQRVVGYGSMSSGPVDTELISTLQDAGVPFVGGSDYAMTCVAKVAARNQWAKRSPGEPVAVRPAPIQWPEDPAKLTVTVLWEILEAYGLPVAKQEVVSNAADAAAAAARVGYPVALKAASLRVSHKSDIGGVRLGLSSSSEVESAYDEVVTATTELLGDEARDVIVQAMAPSGVELLMGITRDPALGTAVVVGSGGMLVELIEDVSVGILPLGEAEATDMLTSLRGYKLLDGLRGAPLADVKAAIRTITAVGEFATGLPDYVRSVDLNPVMVHPAGDGATCVDVWVEVG